MEAFVSPADPTLAFLARKAAVRREKGSAGEVGFTLIEIMVALAVFSLAALALIRLEGQTIRSTGVVRATLLAQMVARNVAIDAVTGAQPPPRGATSGVEQNGGLPWRWTRIVAPIGDGDVQRVDVTVADQSGATLGRMTMVRAPTPLVEVGR
jgi:general secretion pathway protein I